MPRPCTLCSDLGKTAMCGTCEAEARRFYAAKPDLPEGFHHLRGPFCHAASTLFYQGGEITDCGLRFRDGVDQARAIRLLWALLRSYRTKHEHKIGGVGFLLSQWCEEAA